MKTLILFYSYSGNTRKVAEIIAAKLGCDLAEIETVKPYPSNYNAVVEQAKHEVKSGFEPETRPLSLNPDDYDTIILGTPAWWYTFAPPLKTALSAYNWNGKTVYPFVTHGGGPGATLKNIGSACKGAIIKQGLDVYFSSTNAGKSETEILAWAKTIRLV